MSNWFTSFKHRLRITSRTRLPKQKSPSPKLPPLDALKLKIKTINRRRLAQRRGAIRVTTAYTEWIKCHDTLTPEVRLALGERMGQLQHCPRIAVIMPVYNPNLVWLKEAIESVKTQIYPHWELCIADDASTDPAVKQLLREEAAREPRIQLTLRERNGHISACSNSALALVSAEYFATLDHDDLLCEHALLLMAEAINHWPQASVFYSDEDKLNNGVRCDPHFKSDWNPELLLSQNYLCHLLTIKTSLARDKGGFRLGFEGAQDHDLALRCTQGLGPSDVIHIPHVLYHWRQHEGSTAQGAEAKPYAAAAGVRSVQEHLDRAGIAGTVETEEHGWYRARFTPIIPAPLVSLIIPTRNGLAMLRICISSILEKTTHPNFEIIIVDNGSDDPETLRYLDELVASDTRIRTLRDDGPFNYSALNNKAAKLARGEYLALVNNDVEVITPDWLSEMVCLASLQGVGAVGARLWYSDHTLQHGGVVVGIGGVAGHSHKRIKQHQPGYCGRACLLQSMSAVTAACLVVRKSSFEAVGGLDEASLAVAFNDVDFCLRLRTAGYRNIWTPYAELFHHESVSRGSDFAPDKKHRFNLECKVMQARWSDELETDPAYNPNLTHDHEDFSLASTPRVSLMRPWFERPKGYRPPEPVLLKRHSLINQNTTKNLCNLVFEQLGQSGKGALNILEIGCSPGHLGRTLKERGHRVTGIESQPDAAAEANQHLDTVFCCTVDEFLEEDNLQDFDAILFGKPIEPLANPELMLQKVGRHMTPGATLTISAYNVAHASLRAMLLEGRWACTSLGITNDTPLNLFTSESLIRLLSRSGFAIQCMGATMHSASDVNQSFSLGISPKSIAWVDLLGQDARQSMFQFVVTARLADDKQAALRANAQWLNGHHKIQIPEQFGDSDDKQRMTQSLACVEQDFRRLLQQEGL